MKIRFFFPSWDKIPQQTPFDLPPLGVIQAAACVPPDVEVELINENVQEPDFSGDYDIAAISVMLSAQAPRAYEMADFLRSKGKTVIMGGQHVTLCPQEALLHSDAIVTGEAEGIMEKVIDDYRRGKLKNLYCQENFIDISSAPLPRRDLHDKKKYYTVKGWELVDLVQTSRGCCYNCYPCSVTFLEGREQRRSTIQRTLLDLERCGKRIFLVDNSLDQNLVYQRELLNAVKDLGKRWVSHPIHPDPVTMEIARKAGWWYVYMAVYKISEQVRERIKMYHDNGIGVEATVMLGLDYHTEDFIKRLVEFLLEVEVDLAEFTIMTPFPHSRLWEQMKNENRIITRDWKLYNTANVVFKPAKMSPERLYQLYQWAWEIFYENESQIAKMGKLLLRSI